MTILLILLTIFSFPTIAQSSDITQAPQAAQSMPLAPDNNSSSSDRIPEGKKHGSSLLPTMGALAVVIGVFLVILWMLKKTEGPSGRQIPSSIVKTLGKTRIGTTPVFLVAVGKKLTLVAVSSNGLTPLAEIDDPAESEAIRKALEGENGGEK